MKRILTGMTNTMNAVKPPRITALRDLHNAETGPFSILIGTILSARTKDETTTKAVKALFLKYKNPEDLANAKIKDVEKIFRSANVPVDDPRSYYEVAKIIHRNT